MGISEKDYVDYGTAPVVRVRGLARVDQIGADALFAFWSFRKVVVDGQIRQIAEIVHNLAIPLLAVGPGVDLTVTTFGPRMLWPATSAALRRFLT
jgi:hypothetical protein